MTWPYALPTTPTLSRGMLDRAAERRGDSGWLRAAWESPTSRVLVDGPGGRVAPTDKDRLALIPSRDAPDGERYLLGVEGDTTVFALRAQQPIA